jgi:hypothetical protein
MMFSSISEEDRPTVIKNCYWPLFKLADMGVPIGIEASALTLEIIHKINPKWTEVLAKYVSDKKIEFIGSGYSQLIGPLVPATVNDWNQKIGLQCYEKILGMRPSIILVNEMAYSSGMIEHYVKYNYKAFIMEWNNPRFAHPEWDNELRYFPQMVTGQQKSNEMPVIWSDSIAFQKFQRYVFGEHDIIEYMKYLDSHRGPKSRFFPLYSNDVEIFNFRPGRYHTETDSYGNLDWERIFDLYDTLQRSELYSLVSPSDVLIGLNNNHGGTVVNLESVEQPIPVKKQAKYNVNRWALSGRDDLFINSSCYSIYNYLVATSNTNVTDWKELCYLWSSDFRTHITDARWNHYKVRLSKTLRRHCDDKPAQSKYPDETSFGLLDVVEKDRIIEISTNSYYLELDKQKGCSIKMMNLGGLDNFPLIGHLSHGYYDDISLGADYYSGHAVIDRAGEHKITDLQAVNPIISIQSHSCTIKSNHEVLDTRFSSLLTASKKGVTIEKIFHQTNSSKSVFHPFNFTFIPEGWDIESLYISTHNGGSIPETFFLNNKIIEQNNLHSALISATHGYGNTEGVFIVGDNKKSILFKCSMAFAALIPKIIYRELSGTMYLRLQYSAREMDETLKTKDSIAFKKGVKFEISIEPIE